ncbi:tRNA dihydrouridine synthase [Penicillium odoratum]|uniref:tRNA dihydrouridine synthase n=1 Tax=Penicillium odoratum TaxID=1167516 RepID=UPI00254940EC|nr:tRNA dihydrouridine synthase [Penicillium odoratum]KAJ5753257.1 tRNA dihydrouridine synthase [Penicillium odoratum]
MSHMDMTTQKPSKATNAVPEPDVSTRDRDVGSGDEPPAKKARLEGTDSDNKPLDARDRGIAPIKAEYVLFCENQMIID